MRSDPVSVELYSPREGVWAWRVSFDDLEETKTGVAPAFKTAMQDVLETVSNTALHHAAW